MNRYYLSHSFLYYYCDFSFLLLFSFFSLSFFFFSPRPFLGFSFYVRGPRGKRGSFQGPQPGPNLPGRTLPFLRANHTYRLDATSSGILPKWWSPSCSQIVAQAGPREGRSGRFPRGGPGGARRVLEGTAWSNKPNSQLSAPRCRLGDQRSK